MPASYLQAAGELNAELLAINDRFPTYVGPKNGERAFAAEQVAGAITEASRLCAEFIADMARRFGDDGARLDTKAFEEAVSDATKDLTGSLTLFAERLNNEREAA